MTHKEIITEVCLDIFGCEKNEIEVISRFIEGRSNYLYLIKVKDTKYTFRIPLMNYKIFVDHDKEKRILKQLQNLDFLPKTILFDPKSGIEIREYIDGKSITIEEAKNRLKEVATLLKTLHNQKIIDNSVDLKESLLSLEKLVKNEGFKLSKDYLKIRKYFTKKIKKFYDPQKISFTHGDFHISNLILAEEKMFLIDFEFASNREFYFDIASFGNHDFSLAISLLEAYQECEVTFFQEQKLHFYRLYQCLKWYNVAIIKSKHQTELDIDLDFQVIKDNFLIEALIHKKYTK